MTKMNIIRVARNKKRYGDYDIKLWGKKRIEVESRRGTTPLPQSTLLLIQVNAEPISTTFYFNLTI